MEHAGFNTLDYIVLGIILTSGLLAIFTGFVREMYSLFNWAASYFIAVRFYFLAEPFVKRFISNRTTAADASIFLVFCASFFVLALLGMLVAGLVRGNALTAIDRSLGFVFGLVRGILIVCILYLVAESVLWPDIDKAPPVMTPAHELVAPEDGKPKSEDKQGFSMAAPHWLIQARTRPLLAHGADALREFIPEKALEKTTEEYLQQKETVHEKVDKAIGSDDAKKSIEHYSGQ
jgi:membrane protein required for colicin V production